jgi:hypothetical protein
MATPNYSYEKRQKELAKKRKKEDKLKQKTQRKTSDGEPGAEDAAGAAAVTHGDHEFRLGRRVVGSLKSLELGTESFAIEAAVQAGH